MATPTYDGGIGGKFRKRPFRRAPAKPYDRPTSAARGGLRGLSAEAGDGDWISKLAGGASRLITDGASRIFSSFFHKRLAAPPAAPAAPEESHQSRQEVPQVACITPSSELQDQGGFGGHEPIENPGTKYSDADGISELEQLVKQKTFTRIEFDRLMELLHSRTVETVTLEPAVVIEKGKNENASAQENGTGKSKLHENFSAPAGSLTNKAASPAELAKAYMGSRPSKVSPSTLSLRSQVFQEDTIMPISAPYVSKPFNLSVAPRSAIRFSGTPELPENGYQTPKPRRRSAICRMSCSPYFKPHLTTDTKGWRPSGDDYTGLSSSQLTTRNLMYSGGRQVLKRGRSVLDSDFGSFGPIRRMHQKSYLMPPSKDGYSTQLNKDVIEGSSSVHKLSHLDELKYNSTGVQDAHDEDNKISYAKVTPIPPKSTETAMRILQQLDKLVPSPKEKSSELQVIAREESPTLTHNMLRGWSPRNMEGLDSLKSFNIQDSGSLDTDRDSQLLGLRSSLRKKQDVVEESEENGPLKPAGNKLISEACSTVNAAIPSTDAKTFSSSSSSVLPPRQNPSFQMSTSEDLLLLDDANYNMRNASTPLSAKMNKLESRMLRHDTAETAILAKSMPSPKSLPGSNSILLREADMKANGRPSFAEKDIGFTFPVSSSPSTHCQPPPTSTVPAPSLDGLALQKERTVVPVFNFVSKAACTLAFSSTIGVSDTAGQNVGASDAAMETSIEGPTIVKGDEVQKTNFLSKSYGNSVYSDIPTTASAVFGFGASSTSSQNNGLLHLPSLTSPVSAASAITHSDIRVTSTLFTSTATTTSISSSSSSSVAPIFSKANSFQFGSSTSMGNPVSVSHLVNKSDSTNLETKPAKASTFSTSTLTIPYTSSSSFSASTTSAFPSSDGSSSTLAISAAFPSVGNSSSSAIPSSMFSSTGRGIFGLSASAQPSTSTFSLASNSSPDSTTTSGALAGSVFGTPSTQSGSGSSLFTWSSTSQFGSLSSSSFDVGSTTGGFSFSGGSVSSSPGTNSSFEPSATISLLKTGSQPSTSSAFGFSFGSSISSPSTGISFGLSSSAPSSSTFGSSTGPVLSFTSSGSTTSSISSPAMPVFGMPTPAIGFSSGSPRNNQMNVEDSMADDTNQSAVSMVSTFGQPTNLPAATNSVFGSTVVSSGGSPVFQFVGHQNPSSQSSSPFEAGNLVPPGGGFSVGSGGGGKSGRKFIKVKRDKLRKK